MPEGPKTTLKHPKRCIYGQKWSHNFRDRCLSGVTDDKTSERDAILPENDDFTSKTMTYAQKRCQIFRFWFNWVCFKVHFVSLFRQLKEIICDCEGGFSACKAGF